MSYHIKKLVSKGVLKKEHGHYELSENYEHIIPYISDKKSIVTVVLIAIKNKDKIFLHERKKKPFIGKFGLPGGRIVIRESIKNATERIMKEKFSIKCEFEKVNSFSLEHVKKEGKIVHSFILILVTATTKENLKYSDIELNKSKIISSDYKLLKKDLSKEVKVSELTSTS